MARKPIPEMLKKQIITLKSTGASISEIMKTTNLSKSTVENYIKKFSTEIERMREEGTPINELVHGKEELQEETKKKEDKDKPKKPKFANIEEETTRKAITKGSESVSQLKAKEITEDYKAAQMLHSASVRYQKNIEMMGLGWDQFVAWAVDQAYEQAVEAYKEKIDRQLKEASLLQEAIEEELENPMPKTEDGMMIEEDE